MPENKESKQNIPTIQQFSDSPDKKKLIYTCFKIFVLVYIFLLTVKLLSTCFEGLGEDFAKELIAVTQNRFFGLFIGIICTSIVQSSSVTTSVAVSMVASNVISIENAIPIIFGANIGTSITNTLVSLGHVSRKEEFQRAFSAALLHDLFNLLSVIILFPIEMFTGILQTSATWLTGIFFGAEGGKFHGPLEVLVKPIVVFFKTNMALLFGVSDKNTTFLICLIIFAFATMIFSLIMISKSMRALALEKLESFLSAYVFRNAPLSFIVGLFFTFIIQSSSVTTSLMIPLAAAGVVNLYQLFPYVLGANLGTTGTALLAALAGKPIGLTLAFVHLLFNIFGSVIWFPFRIVPISIAKEFGKRAAESKKIAVIYVAVIFFIIPGLMILIQELTK